MYFYDLKTSEFLIVTFCCTDVKFTAEGAVFTQ